MESRIEPQATRATPARFSEAKDKMSPKNCALCNASQANNNTKYSRCSGCGITKYCSKACQAEDWRYHKHICKEFCTFTAAIPRPSNTHRLAMLFPANEKKVQMAWVQCGIRLSDPRVGDFITSSEVDVPIRRYLAFKYPKFKRFDLDHNIRIIVGDKKDDTSNVCIGTIFKNKPKFDWKGRILILSDDSDEYHEEGDGPVVYQDVTTSDFRVVMDFMTEYNDERFDSKFLNTKSDVEIIQEKLADFMFNPAAQLKGVRISSNSDRHFLGAPVYVEENIQHDDEIFNKAPTGVTLRLGIPIMMRRCGRTDWSKGENAWHDEFGPGPRDNKAANLMNLCTDPSHRKNFGRPHVLEEDVGGMGSVIVVRQDRKPVTAEQVEAIAQFIEKEIVVQIHLLNKSMIEYRSDGRIEKARREFVDLWICPAKFGEFFDRLKRERVENGKRYWDDIVSPLDA